MCLVIHTNYNRKSSLDEQQQDLGLWNYWYPSPIHQRQGADPESVNASINLSSPSYPGEPKEVTVRKACKLLCICLHPSMNTHKLSFSQKLYMHVQVNGRWSKGGPYH